MRHRPSSPSLFSSLFLSLSSLPPFLVPPSPLSPSSFDGHSCELGHLGGHGGETQCPPFQGTEGLEYPAVSAAVRVCRQLTLQQPAFLALFSAHMKCEAWHQQ